jgi:Derlin-2/3
MVYVWARRNPYVRMSFLGLFSFNAPYLPWVLLSFSVVLGNSATIDLIGIIVGHVYYFLEDVYPLIADIRGWQVRRWLAAPVLLKQLFGEHTQDGMRGGVQVAPPVVDDALADVGVDAGANVNAAAGANGADAQENEPAEN